MTTERPTTVLLLAPRAVVAAASGNHDAFDGRFADEARVAFAAIDAVLQLEKAFFAVCVHIIGDGRATQGNRLLQNFLHRGEQFSKLVACDRRGPPARANSGAK